MQWAARQRDVYERILEGQQRLRAELVEMCSSTWTTACSAQHGNRHSNKQCRWMITRLLKHEEIIFFSCATCSNKATTPTKKAELKLPAEKMVQGSPVAPMAFHRCRKSELLQTLNCKKLFTEKKKMLPWSLVLFRCVVLCEALKKKKENGWKRVSVLCLPSNPVWHFMCDIIFGLSRICGLQSRTCGCTLGINPHLNPIGR